MSVAPKVKTKFIEKTHQKVWNITDHPETDVKPANMMVAGQIVAPGGYIKVPLELLKGATKLKRSEDARQIYVGERPPEDYISARGTQAVRAQVPAEATRSHGERNPGGGEAIMEEARKQEEAQAEEEQPEVEVTDEPVDEQSSEEGEEANPPSDADSESSPEGEGAEQPEPSQENQEQQS